MGLRTNPTELRRLAACQRSEYPQHGCRIPICRAGEAQHSRRYHGAVAGRTPIPPERPLDGTSETTPPAGERGFLGLPICRYFPRCADRTERNDVHGASARQPAYLLPACSMYGRGVYPTGRYRPANAAIPHRAVQRLQILYAVPLWTGYSSHPAALQPLHQRGQRAAEQPRRELPRGTPRLPDRL